MIKTQSIKCKTGQLVKTGQNPVFGRNTSFNQGLQTGYRFPKGESGKKHMLSNIDAENMK